MFIRLGMLSITRQLSRSALALVTLVMAAISLTASLTISSGYPAQAFRNYRDYLGGDIVAYPVRIMTSNSEDGKLELYRLPKNEFSTLTMFYPHIANEGFLSRVAPVLRPMHEADREALLRNPEIVSLCPLYRLPVSQSLNGSRSEAAIRALTEADPLEQYLVSQLSPELRSGAMPIWLNERPAEGVSLPNLGQEIELIVPSLLVAPDGSVQIDDTVRQSLAAQVAGFYALPTQEISWSDGQGGMMSEQGYFDRPEIWVSQANWEHVWAMAAPGQEPQAFSYGLTVRNMGSLEAVAGELQVNNPAMTIVSAPNLAKLAQKSQLIDHFKFLPREFQLAKNKPQFGLPQDMGKIISLFIYLNAGLLMAARMLTGAAARRKEIGILKAIGARRRDIMLMALTEAVVLSVIGSTIGFILAYSAALLQQLTNHVAITSILLDLVKSFGLVIGETVAIGLVFGLLPAWRLSKLTVNEVLRS